MLSSTSTSSESSGGVEFSGHGDGVGGRDNVLMFRKTRDAMVSRNGGSKKVVLLCSALVR